MCFSLRSSVVRQLVQSSAFRHLFSALSVFVCLSGRASVIVCPLAYLFCLSVCLSVCLFVFFICLYLQFVCVVVRGAPLTAPFTGGSDNPSVHSERSQPTDMCIHVYTDIGTHRTEYAQ
jgi:hypothetical protein